MQRACKLSGFLELIPCSVRRHLQKQASASTLMLEQEEKYKQDQKRELHSVNTGASLAFCSFTPLHAVVVQYCCISPMDDTLMTITPFPCMQL
jgi:hypothetical protein